MQTLTELKFKHSIFGEINGAHHCNGYDFATNARVLILVPNKGNPNDYRKIALPERHLQKCLNREGFMPPIAMQMQYFKNAFDLLDRADIKTICDNCKGSGEDEDGSDCFCCDGNGYTSIKRNKGAAPHDYALLKLGKHRFEYYILKWVQVVADELNQTSVAFFEGLKENTFSFFEFSGGCIVVVMPIDYRTGLNEKHVEVFSGF